MITTLYVVIAVINKVKGTTCSAAGVIVGVLAAGGALIWNMMAALVNGAISLFAELWNFLAAFANFFANFLRDPIGAAAHLVAGFCETALNLISALAGAIDTLFGSSVVSSINGWIDRLGGFSGKRNISGAGPACQPTGLLSGPQVLQRILSGRL